MCPSNVTEPAAPCNAFAMQKLLMSIKLTKKHIETTHPGARRKVTYDTEVTGLHLVVTPRGKKTLNLWYRTTSGRAATMKLGDWPIISLHLARDRARKLLYEVSGGGDPAHDRSKARNAPTMGELCDRYLTEHVSVRNKPNTAREFRKLVEARIRPCLGAFKVADVSRSDVISLHLQMKDSPYSANRTIAVISKMFALAEEWDLRPIYSNPCRGIKRYPEKPRQRFLNDSELALLGAALEEAEKAETVALEIIIALRLLALTGCRASEVLQLIWKDVSFDQGILEIRDAKAGSRAHSVGNTALDYLASIQRRDDCPYVIGREISIHTLERGWRRIRGIAQLADCRIHDLRHTVGTFAGQSGANAFLVRDKLGHKTLALTDRYVEKDSGPLRNLSDKIEIRIAAAMATRN